MSSVWIRGLAKLNIVVSCGKLTLDNTVGSYYSFVQPCLYFFCDVLLHSSEFICLITLRP